MTKSFTIQKNILNLLSDNKSHSVSEIKEYLHAQQIIDYTEGQFAGSINTLIRNKSIKKIERGIYQLCLRRENMRKCFVVSPIGKENSDVRKKADQLFKYIISPACEEMGFDPIRVDQVNQSDSITQTIIDGLENYDLVIADISGHNPNVFFEMGYRTATGKPIIHLKEKNEDIPFDIAGIRAFDYDLNDLDSVEEIKNRLIQTINAFSFDDDKEEIKETNSDISQLMPILYNIQDEVSNLKKEIQKKDTETIQTIVQAAKPSIQNEDPNTAMLKLIIPEMLKNPESVNNLLKLSEMVNNKK